MNPRSMAFQNHLTLRLQLTLHHGTYEMTSVWGTRRTLHTKIGLSHQNKGLDYSPELCEGY